MERVIEMLPTYGIEAIDVYPQTLSAVEYSYGNSQIR